MSTEIEIKLAADPAKISNIKQWLSDKYQVHDGWQEKPLLSTYYDTANRHLRTLQIGLRIRRDGDNFIQTVKSAGRVVGGLFQRNESETQVASEQLDLLAVSDPYLMILLEEAQDEDGALMPVFSTDFTRQQVVLVIGDGEIEVALDQGRIVGNSGDGAKDYPISEVELELKSGQASSLFELCQQLIEQFDLVLDSQSKAERGYRLSSKPSPYLKKLDVVSLTAKSSAEGTFESIAHSGLEHWQHYIKSIKREITVDSVLQLNRALLFMQHLYSVFAPLIPRNSLHEVRQDWREVTKNFAKSLKIALEINWLNNARLYGFEYPELAELERGLHRAFKTESERFVEYLDTPSYNLKMLHFSRWLYMKEWRSVLKESAEQRLQKEVYPFAIRQLQHQLLDIERHLAKDDLNEQDYLDFLPKMYRTLDIGLFFGSLFDSKKRRKYRQNWVDLVANIELFKQLEFVRMSLKSEQKIDSRLEQTEQEILAMLREMSQVAFEQNPYWN